MSKIPINESYEKFKNEVAEVRDCVRKNLIPGTREEELYKGTMILYSELIYNPNFMFIGINPGAGYYRQTGCKYRPEELDPENELEYLAALKDGYDYTLAKQTRTAFERTKYKDSLSKSVKTNLFYTSTNAKEMGELFNRLFDKFNINYYEKSLEWTKILISLIEPKIIICEGKVVVEELGKYYDTEPKWNNETATFQIDGAIRVVGYKRRFSHIKNINDFVMALNNL